MILRHSIVLVDMDYVFCCNICFRSAYTIFE